MTPPADLIRLLRDHHADVLEHPRGTLLEHLERTAATLTGWGSPDELVVAGLCHAVYGTVFRSR